MICAMIGFDVFGASSLG